MKILAIESSCDETSASVLEKEGTEIRVLSNITATSIDIHATTGGIIPENAARMQVKYIIPVIVKALCALVDDRLISKDTGWEMARVILKNDIDAIAVTFGPGLIGSLLVGVETAKTLSYVFKKPIIPVNHLLAHIYANFISKDSRLNIKDITFPFVGLIVSGGHTDILLFKRHGKYEWLGGTRDDAAGEALDKIGRLLDLSYPAGPEIERRANLVSNPAIKFKSPIINEDNYDFSFSGLKTEVLRFVQKSENLDAETINQICYATQKAIIDVLVRKTQNASTNFNCKAVLVGGGVSANQEFINQLKLNAKRTNLNPQIFSPEKIFCTDNGAMIGAYALLNFKTKNWDEVKANPELYFS